MDKREKKVFGAWISLMGGAIFVLGGLAAIYILFVMDPQTTVKVISWLGRTFRNS